jgi:SPP1 family predicted phage head-tail adaptor
MDAGALRDRIRIQRKATTKNAVGGLTEGWNEVATVSANIVSLNGREAIIGNILQGVSFFQITIRYRTDLKPSDQILWLSRLDANGEPRELNVVNAEDRMGTRQWTVIQASTEAPQGA